MAAYEPIILVQKPLEKGLNVAKNIIKYCTGALNLEETRIPTLKPVKLMHHLILDPFMKKISKIIY